MEQDSATIETPGSEEESVSQEEVAVEPGADDPSPPPPATAEPEAPGPEPAPASASPRGVGAEDDQLAAPPGSAGDEEAEELPGILGAPASSAGGARGTTRAFDIEE